MSRFQLLRERGTPRPEVPAQTPATPDANLTLMLAQQAIARWQFDLERFGEAAASDNDLVVSESDLSIQQIRALRDRIAPFRHYVDMALRFEAEEVLVALTGLEASFARVVHRRQPNPPWRNAAEVAEDLNNRRH